MGKRLFVASLPFETTAEQLRSIFEASGRVVHARVVEDRLTSRSKGFGFVEMETEAEASAAIQQFDGSTVGVRRIVVQEARPVESREAAGARQGQPSGQRSR
ncbi:MAG: RNA-binding protein [Elusimicrobia bacterium]|nr:RNA-binding protein [Elusimicrobiota bacterium]